jgi:OPT oligopeptide transporter protein
MYVPSPEAFQIRQFIGLFTKSDQWLLVMSTQLIGFSIGSICKPILIAPASMIWPYTLAYAAIFNTLHSHETTGTHASGGVSRARFFTYVFVGYFLYSQFLFINYPTLEVCPFS